MRRIARVFGWLVALLLVGSAGYYFIENFEPLDALYQTVITVSTVGFGEVRPLSPAGKLFTVFLISFGIGVATYAAAQIGHLVVGGELRELLGRRRVRQRVRELSGHYIICGFGRMGRVVAQDLASKKVQFVIIERDPERVRKALNAGFLVLEADATEEDALLDAGIGRAKGLAAALDSDPDNLYLVVTAKSLNPKVFVVAKALTEEGARKLKAGGADKTVALYEIGAKRMAMALLRPQITEFLDLTVGSEKVLIEGIEIFQDSPLAGKTLRELDLRRRFGVTVIAARRGDELVVSPGPDFVPQVGDVLFVIGSEANLKGLTNG